MRLRLILSRNLLGAGIYFILISECLNAQDKLIFQLIDDQTQNPVPFAYIKIIDKNILELSNEDGFFTLPKLYNDSIQISHVAYKSINTSFEKIKNLKTIGMTELAIETNPIIINARSAKSFVERAIDSTYKAMHEPIYFTCFRKDQLVYHDTLVAKAEAELVYYMKDLFSAGHGVIIKGYIKNVIVGRDPNLTGILIPPYSIPASYAPINRFLVGVSPGPEKNIYYSNQEANDSLLIIGINPKRDFTPKKYILKYGRFIINKNTWRLLRIDTNLSTEMMELGRDLKLKTTKKGKYPFHYSVSYFFGEEGYLSKILLNYQFSYNENNPNNIWQNHSEIIYIPEKTKPEFNELNLLKRDTLLIQMNSSYSPGFEKRFLDYIH
jgi:hypothetical protein